VHVVDGRIAWLGNAAAAPAAGRVVAGEGALLTPSFVDGHVHATATGLALGVLDLHSSSSLTEALAAVAGHAGGAGVLLGTGWDETG
jgi:predicted amidohydrolase YtcJ